jgi:hypothetical protein
VREEYQVTLGSDFNRLDARTRVRGRPSADHHEVEARGVKVVPEDAVPLLHEDGVGAPVARSDREHDRVVGRKVVASPPLAT